MPARKRIDDVRWFAENASHGVLVVPRLQAHGLSVAVSGDAPARVVVALGNTVAVDAWRFAVKHRSRLAQFIWDLPPWRLRGGRYDPVWSLRGRLLSVPRFGRRYAERAGLYSQLRYVAAHAHTVWCPSQSTAADVTREFGVRGELVPYCYDSDRFTPGAPSLSQTTPPTLLSVSRLMPMKNHEAVIRAGHRLGMAVRIIGPGPLRAALQKEADALNVPCTIESGWITDQQVVAAYRDATVVVCPSRFEGMGLSGLEGASCGTPVVASDISTHREFLTGVAQFFTLDDDESMDRAIRAALQAPRPSAWDVTEYGIDAAARRFHTHLEALLH